MLRMSGNIVGALIIGISLTAAPVLYFGDVKILKFLGWIAVWFFVGTTNGIIKSKSNDRSALLIFPISVATQAYVSNVIKYGRLESGWEFTSLIGSFLFFVGFFIGKFLISYGAKSQTLASSGDLQRRIEPKNGKLGPS